MNNDPSELADKSAIAISVICVLHCLFTPLLLVSAPYLTGFAIFEGEALHLWLLCLVVPISIGSIGYGFSKHGDKSTLYLAGTGILLLILALTVGHDLFEHLGETLLTILGSIFIATGHIKNLKLRQANFV